MSISRDAQVTRLVVTAGYNLKNSIFKFLHFFILLKECPALFSCKNFCFSNLNVLISKC